MPRPGGRYGGGGDPCIVVLRPEELFPGSVQTLRRKLAPVKADAMDAIFSATRRRFSAERTCWATVCSVFLPGQCGQDIFGAEAPLFFGGSTTCRMYSRQVTKRMCAPVTFGRAAQPRS